MKQTSAAPAPYRVWLNEKQKIASFHELRSGTLREFWNSELFYQYLFALSDQWYAFE